MAFTGFIPATDQIAINDANNAITLGRLNPYVEGTKFRVTGFTYVQSTEDGEVRKDPKTNKPILVPALNTTVGEPIRISELIRSVSTTSGDVIERTGTANKAILETIIANHGKSNGELLQAVVNMLGNREIVCHTKPYTSKNRNGETFTGTFRNFDFV